MKEGDRVRLLGVVPTQHFTSRRRRFSEASLVKALEDTHWPPVDLCIHHFDVARPRVRDIESRRFTATDIARS